MVNPDTSNEETETDARRETTLFLLRFSGDLTTKADATRRRMTSRLVENLRTSLKSSGRAGKVVRDRNRLFVALEKTEDPDPVDLEPVKDPNIVDHAEIEQPADDNNVDSAVP